MHGYFLARSGPIIVLCDHVGIDATRPYVDKLMSNIVVNSPLLYTVDDIYERLRNGKFQLWLFQHQDEDPHLMVVTHVERFPRGSIATIMLLAGSHFRHAKAFAGRFEDWCREVGCQYIHFECSPKVAKIMQKLGYTATAMAVYKPLYLAN